MTQPMSEEDAQQLRETIEAASAQFQKLCQDRHDIGAEKYGALTWMGNDIVRMMIEELADTVNYCHYQAIKLMLMQDVLAEELSEKLDGETDIQIGVQAFKGTKDVGWIKK